MGVFRPLPSTTMGSTSGIFKSLLICNNVGVIGKEVGAVHLTGSDVKHIRLVLHDFSICMLLVISSYTVFYQYILRITQYIILIHTYIHVLYIHIQRALPPRQHPRHPSRFTLSIHFRASVHKKGIDFTAVRRE